MYSFPPTSSTATWEGGLPPQFARSKILYSDEFCKMTDEILIIKKFFFGTLRPKVVFLKDIRVVYFDEQTIAQRKYSHRRIWGRAHGKSIYWAADFKRCLPGIDKANKSDVIVDLEDGMLKGFTVSDVQSFLSVVRLCAPISTIIVDHLDFA
ncbi:unnamed protein product [Meloidogyne enterolobii]|uniref:Uncharacterized protein n=5 Tax=Meloidogyne TaxID=189290 RepID=A0ACB0XTM7_MELEN|nr:unnamed protein product [Meloidogyne enterolobii]